jgi:hypothetical protein
MDISQTMHSDVDRYEINESFAAVLLTLANAMAFGGHDQRRQRRKLT